MHPRSLHFTVQGVAHPKGSARAFVIERPGEKPRAIVTSDNRSVKTWERTVRDELQQVMRATSQHVLLALYNAPIALTLVFHLPRPKSAPRRQTRPTKKPDLSKLIRATEDALVGVLIRDDALVCEINAQKVYATTAAKVVILVEAVEEVAMQTEGTLWQTNQL